MGGFKKEGSLVRRLSVPAYLNPVSGPHRRPLLAAASVVGFIALVTYFTTPRYRWYRSTFLGVLEVCYHLTGTNSLTLLLLILTRIDLVIIWMFGAKAASYYLSIRGRLFRCSLAALLLVGIIYAAFFYVFPYARYKALDNSLHVYEVSPQFSLAGPPNRESEIISDQVTDQTGYFVFYTLRWIYKIESASIYHEPIYTFLLIFGFIMLLVSPPLFLRRAGEMWAIPVLRGLTIWRWVSVPAVVFWLVASYRGEEFRPYLYIIGAGFLIFILLWIVPKWQVAHLVGAAEKKDVFSMENEARKTVAQILGGALLLLGVYYTAQNFNHANRVLEATQEGQITERFSKAIELLGKSSEDKEASLANRLGGIHALERIAKDSKKDHWTIMEILTAYVRENASVESFEAARLKFRQTKRTVAGRDVKFRWPPPDIQEILLVLGRRAWRDSEPDVLYMPRIVLGGGDETDLPLGGGHYEKANFSGANLDKAFFGESYLTGAKLDGALLRNAILESADLRGADMKGSFLDDANLINADLRNADLRNAVLDRADLSTADLREANLEGASLKGARCATDLSQTKGLTESQLKEAASYWPGLLPSGIKLPPK